MSYCFGTCCPTSGPRARAGGQRSTGGVAGVRGRFESLGRSLARRRHGEGVHQVRGRARVVPRRPRVLVLNRPDLTPEGRAGGEPAGEGPRAPSAGPALRMWEREVQCGEPTGVRQAHFFINRRAFFGVSARFSNVRVCIVKETHVRGAYICCAIQNISLHLLAVVSGAQELRSERES